MPVVTVGGIGSPQEVTLSGKITKIEVKDNVGFHALYDGLSKFIYEIPTGVSWELRVSMTASCSTGSFANPWMTAVSVVTNIPGYEKNCKVRYDESSKSISAAFDFGFGRMGSTKVTITRVKLWVTDRRPLFTAETPPESEW